MLDSKRKIKPNCLSQLTFQSGTKINLIVFQYKNQPANFLFKLGIDNQLQISSLRIISQSINKQQIQQLVATLPNLKKLCVSNNRLNQQTLLLISKHFKKLQFLTIDKSLIEQHTLKQVVNNLKNLKYFVIKGTISFQFQKYCNGILKSYNI